jgi:hypothetical protein
MKFKLILLFLFCCIPIFAITSVNDVKPLNTKQKAKIYVKNNYPNIKKEVWTSFKDDDSKYYVVEFIDKGRVIQIEFFSNGDLNYVAKEFILEELPDTIQNQLKDSRIFFTSKVEYYDGRIEFYVNAERNYKVNSNKIEEFDMFFDVDGNNIEEKTTMLKSKKEGVPMFFRITYILLIFYLLFSI